MGEARRRQQAQRAAWKQQFLYELDCLSVPPMDGEAELHAEIQALPALAVPRVPLHTLEWMRMKPNECHVNAYQYAHLDPEGLAQMVTGWWCQTPIFRLHSVIRRDGSLMCITPSPVELLRFRPDPLIELRDERGGFKRLGVPLPATLRPDPLATIDAAIEARAKLATGVEVDELPMDLLERLGCLEDAGQWV